MAISSIREETRVTPTRSRTQSAGVKEETAMRSVAWTSAWETSFCEVFVVSSSHDERFASSRTWRTYSAQALSARVAIEAYREAWHVHDVLTQWGHDVLLVDTTRTKQIGIRHQGRNTDRIDAELLARAVEQGAIPIAHVLSPARRELRVVLGVRRALVETRTQYITTIRGLARSRGRAACILSS